MDLCHCAEPKITTNESGSKLCEKCKLWYDEKEWKRDPRRLRAARDKMIEEEDAHAAAMDILYGKNRVNKKG